MKMGTKQQLCAYYRKSTKRWVCEECIENLTQMQFSTRCSLCLHTINIHVTSKQVWLVQAIFWIKIDWLQTQQFLNRATNKAIVIYRGTDMCDFNIMLVHGKHDKHFKNVNVQFQQVAENCMKQGIITWVSVMILKYRDYCHKRDIVSSGAWLECKNVAYQIKAKHAFNAISMDRLQNHIM